MENPRTINRFLLGLLAIYAAVAIGGEYAQVAKDKGFVTIRKNPRFSLDRFGLYANLVRVKIGSTGAGGGGAAGQSPATQKVMEYRQIRLSALPEDGPATTPHIIQAHPNESE